MYVRLDWIKNLNNKIETVLASEGRNVASMSAQDIEDAKFTATGPVDMLEFYRLARAFRECDPDNNGTKDTYGYTNTGKTDLFADCWIFEAFGAGYDRMVDSDGDGSYESSYANDNTKKALAFMNKMFKEGLLHPAFFEHGLQEKQDCFTNGQVGIIEGHMWYNTILQSYIATKNIAEPTDAQIELYSKDIGVFNPPVGETGKGGINGNPNFWTVMCLNAAMDDEEVVAALDLMDFLLSAEGRELLTNGVEGTHYQVYGTEYTSLTDKTKGWQNPLKVEDGAASISCISNLSASYLSVHQANYKKIIAQMEEARKYAAYADYAFLQPEAYVVYWGPMKDYAQQQFVMMIRDLSLSSSASIKNPTYEDLNNLANVSAFSNRWNSFMSELKSQHLDEVVSAYNKAIDNGAMKVERSSLGLGA
jgi:ABC-type glycerol-3-phosphate transport system substrate-binding protein